MGEGGYRRQFTVYSTDKSSHLFLTISNGPCLIEFIFVQKRPVSDSPGNVAHQISFAVHCNCTDNFEFHSAACLLIF